MEKALREVETPIKSTRSCVVPKHQAVKKPLAAKEKEVKDGASNEEKDGATNEEKGGASNSLSKDGAEQKDSPSLILETKHTICPKCRSPLSTTDRSEEKVVMTVYGFKGVSVAVHKEARCQWKGCRYTVRT